MAIECDTTLMLRPLTEHMGSDTYRVSLHRRAHMGNANIFVIIAKRDCEVVDVRSCSVTGLLESSVAAGGRLHACSKGATEAAAPICKNGVIDNVHRPRVWNQGRTRIARTGE